MTTSLELGHYLCPFLWVPLFLKKFIIIYHYYFLQFLLGKQKRFYLYKICVGMNGMALTMVLGWEYARLSVGVDFGPESMLRNDVLVFDGKICM